MNLEKFIRDVPNFPNDWVLYKDITPILGNSEAFAYAVDKLSEELEGVDKIVWIDARGFLFASVIAYKLEKPLAIIRKAWKLPFECINEPFALARWESGMDLHVDAIKDWESVAVIDDVLATWGTIGTSIKLIEKLWGRIDSLNFVVELGFLGARERLGEYKVNSLVRC